MSHSALGSHGTSHQSLVPPTSHRSGIHQSQVWNMLSPSCSSCPIVPWYLGILCDVPPVQALALTLAQTRDWCGIPRYHGTMGRDGQEGPSMGCPMGSQGTMGQWDVPRHPTAKSNNPRLLEVVHEATAHSSCFIELNTFMPPAHLQFLGNLGFRWLQVSAGQIKPMFLVSGLSLFFFSKIGLSCGFSF